MSAPAPAPTEPSLPSGIVTFLFTDVVGSTRLFQEHGAAFVDALRLVQDAVRDAVEQSSGVVVSTEGDSTFAAFATAADGVRAALRAQRAVAALPGKPRLAVRAGLHTGAAQPLQGDYLAVPVHIASRVSAAAGAGQVLASDATVSGVGSSMPEADDLGLYELRDVIEPVRLWRVAGSADPPRATPLRRTNIPPSHTSLVGRDDGLAALTELMADHRLLTLVGTGGVGKTRLASEFAARSAAEYAGGAWLVELGGVERDDEVTVAARTALAVDATAKADSDALVDELRRRGATLLVVDNCEHVADGAADLASHLLRSCPEVRLLLTSREALEVDEERVVRLRPLPHADDTAPAEQLFRERALRAGAAADSLDSEAVQDVCRLLDGVPLAIELAASRAATMTIAELRDTLSRDAHLAPLTTRRGDHRQRSLDNLVDWSFRLLAPAQRTDLMCLSVFATRFTGEDASTLLTSARGEGPSALPELVRRGLVDLDGDHYRLLFSVRLPMANRLAAASELTAATDAALVAWAKARVEAARPAGWRAMVGELASQRANLEAALRVALRSGLPAPRVLQVLGHIWDRAGTGLPPDVRAAIEARMQEAIPADAERLTMTLAMLMAVRGIGMSEHEGHRLDRALALVEAARRLGDRAVLRDALATAAPIFVGAGDVPTARAMLLEAIEGEGVNDPWHRPARDLVNLAITYHLGTDPLDALPWYERAIETALRTDDDANAAVATVNIGDVLMTAGRLHEASAMLRRGVKAMSHMTWRATVARAILAEALVRLNEPNALDYARDAERGLVEATRNDRSMDDYLERLRVAIRAAEQRDGAPPPQQEST